jgi:hypothetical protein
MEGAGRISGPKMRKLWELATLHDLAEVKKDMMDRARNTHGKPEMFMKVLARKSEIKNYQEDLSVHQNILLKLMEWNHCGSVQGKITSSCVRGNEFSGSIKCWDSLRA